MATWRCYFLYYHQFLVDGKDTDMLNRRMSGPDSGKMRKLYGEADVEEEEDDFEECSVVDGREVLVNDHFFKPLNLLPE